MRRVFSIGGFGFNEDCLIDKKHEDFILEKARKPGAPGLVALESGSLNIGVKGGFSGMHL